MADEMNKLNAIQRPRARRGWGAAIAMAAAAFVATSSSVSAQNAAAPADGIDEASWRKICSKEPKTNKDLCIINQDLRTDSGQLMVSLAIYEYKDEKRKKMRVLVPPGMLIQAGVYIGIDKSKPKEMKYQICFTNACVTELAVDSNFINALKKGNQLTVTGFSPEGKQVPFKLTLAGFTATYDGEGMDPAALQAQDQKLQEELRKRAAEQRQRLIDAQNEAKQKAN